MIFHLREAPSCGREASPEIEKVFNFPFQNPNVGVSGKEADFIDGIY
jgi:hypothetical protein